jgi:hypothetical protein
MSKYYCEEHKFNPPDGCGFCFCPRCEFPEAFELDNEPEPPPRWRGEDADTKCRQKVLFSGMDCLPGQMDLWDDLDKLQEAQGEFEHD